MDSITLGQKVTAAAIPQVCGYAQQCPEQEQFWRAFFNGMAGAMCAEIGHAAGILVLKEALDTATQHADIINKQTH